jgi:hypothetical protein
MLNRTPSVSIKLTSPPINRWRVSSIQLFNFYLKYWFKSGAKIESAKTSDLATRSMGMKNEKREI